jgi:hypothetical protein
MLGKKGVFAEEQGSQRKNLQPEKRVPHGAIP